MLRITDFSAEYSRGGLLTEEKRPRFSWKLQSEKRNVLQKSFRLIVSGKDFSFDSGEQVSTQSVFVDCLDRDLSPAAEYLAKLTVTDESGDTATAELRFETALMGTGFQSAEFLAPDCKARPNAFTLSKKIVLPCKPKKARAYVSALGMYFLEINGSRVGDIFFAPGWTDYKHTLEYQTYDIAPLLREGENKIEITVGKGWYSGSLNVERTANNYGDTPAAIAELRIASGEKEQIFVTDESWECSSCFITDSELYDGEVQDFTRECISYPVKTVEYEKANLAGQINEPCRVTERIRVKKKFVTPRGETVFDFGQNLVGFVELNVKGLRGKITVRHAETLDKDGNFYTENLRSAKAEDVYLLDGKQATVRPNFTCHGFRYIQILGADLSEGDCTALVIHSDMRRTLAVETSDSLLNRLIENIRWTQRGNFVEVPTDCPQRDERMGWTGDINAFSRTAVLQYDTALFFKKWLGDLRSGQTKDGSVPAFAPTLKESNATAAALWSDSITMIPWELYLTYGDTRFLSENFAAMASYAEKLGTLVDKTGLIQSGYQLGDWLASDRAEPERNKRGRTDEYFIANVFYSVSLKIVWRAAEILGKNEFAKRFSERYDSLLRAMQAEYFTPTGRMACETQTAFALALYFGIVPEEYRSRVVERFRQSVASCRNRVLTGFAGTPYLLTALCEAGLSEQAENVLLNRECPGWLCTVERGATTVWERFDGILPDGTLNDPEMNSFNHYAFGAVGEFIVHKIAGIEPLEAGYKKIRIQPYVTKKIGKISASFESVYGEIFSSYELADGKLTVRVKIPANTSAEIILPNGERREVGSGEYSFTVQMKESKAGRFSPESKISEVLEDESALKIAKAIAPQIFGGDAVKNIAPFTFRKAAGFGGEALKNLFDCVIKELNKVFE